MKRIKFLTIIITFLVFFSCEKNEIVINPELEQIIDTCCIDCSLTDPIRCIWYNDLNTTININSESTAKAAIDLWRNYNEYTQMTCDVNRCDRCDSTISIITTIDTIRYLSPRIGSQFYKLTSNGIYDLSGQPYIKAYNNPVWRIIKLSSIVGGSVIIHCTNSKIDILINY